MHSHKCGIGMRQSGNFCIFTCSSCAKHEENNQNCELHNIFASTTNDHGKQRLDINFAIQSVHGQRFFFCIKRAAAYMQSNHFDQFPFKLAYKMYIPFGDRNSKIIIVAVKNSDDDFYWYNWPMNIEH